MSIRYNVPLIAQTKTLICWHASSEMIWAYWQQKTGRYGPMNTILSHWQTNTPIDVPEFVVLAKKIGMKPVRAPVSFYTSNDIEQILKKHGPIWTAVYLWPQGKKYGHIIVLTGISGQDLFFNDPEFGGQMKQESIAWFNLHLAKNVQDCLMHKDPSAY